MSAKECNTMYLFYQFRWLSQIPGSTRWDTIYTYTEGRADSPLPSAGTFVKIWVQLLFWQVLHFNQALVLLIFSAWWNNWPSAKVAWTPPPLTFTDLVGMVVSLLGSFVNILLNRCLNYLLIILNYHCLC